MKPVRWGVLGIGRHFILRTLVPFQRSEGVELYGVASRDPEKARSTAGEFGIPRAYPSYEALLADPSIEAVFLPLPNHIHAEWIAKAADAGKHILCEKPLALTAAEGRAALEHARTRGVLLMEAFMYRFHPQWVRTHELVRTGHIGAVSEIHTAFGYANADPANIRNILEFGGGAIYDIGCYAVSLSRFLLGSEPIRALGLVTRDSALGIDTLTSGILEFAQARATFTVGTRIFPHQEVDIRGTGGGIRIMIPFNSYDDVPSIVRVTTGVGEREIAFGPADQYRLQFEAFSTAVREGKPAPIPPEDAVGNLAVMDALFRSEQSGTWETVEAG
jgi:predicted dehydrogenase